MKDAISEDLYFRIQFLCLLRTSISRVFACSTPSLEAMSQYLMSVAIVSLPNLRSSAGKGRKCRKLDRPPSGQSILRYTCIQRN